MDKQTYKHLNSFTTSNTMIDMTEYSKLAEDSINLVLQWKFLKEKFDKLGYELVATTYNDCYIVKEKNNES